MIYFTISVILISLCLFFLSETKKKKPKFSVDNLLFGVVIGSLLFALTFGIDSEPDYGHGDDKVLGIAGVYINFTKLALALIFGAFLGLIWGIVVLPRASINLKNLINKKKKLKSTDKPNKHFLRISLSFFLGFIVSAILCICIIYAELSGVLSLSIHNNTDFEISEVKVTCVDDENKKFEKIIFDMNTIVPKKGKSISFSALLDDSDFKEILLTYKDKDKKENTITIPAVVLNFSFVVVEINPNNKPKIMYWP